MTRFFTCLTSMFVGTGEASGSTETIPEASLLRRSCKNFPSPPVMITGNFFGSDDISAVASPSDVEADVGGDGWHLITNCLTMFRS